MFSKEFGERISAGKRGERVLSKPGTAQAGAATRAAAPIAILRVLLALVRKKFLLEYDLMLRSLVFKDIPQLYIQGRQNANYRFSMVTLLSCLLKVQKVKYKICACSSADEGNPLLDLHACKTRP